MRIGPAENAALVIDDQQFEVLDAGAGARGERRDAINRQERRFRRVMFADYGRLSCLVAAPWLYDAIHAAAPRVRDSLARM